MAGYQKKRSINLSNDTWDWIDRVISEGRFTNTNDLIREAIAFYRHRDEFEKELEIKAADSIPEAILSGECDAALVERLKVILRIPDN